jgi:ligand-binding sensor domain-containing protein
MPACASAADPTAERALLSDDYQVEVWDTAQGLPQSTVTALTQTPDGYLWLGTPSGLVCFDGIRFQVFDASRTPAFPGSQVNATRVRLTPPLQYRVRWMA